MAKLRNVSGETRLVQYGLLSLALAPGEVFEVADADLDSFALQTALYAAVGNDSRHQAAEIKHNAEES